MSGTSIGHRSQWALTYLQTAAMVCTTLLATGVSAQSAHELCLLEALRAANADTSVASVRARCAAAPNSVSRPTADAPSTPGLAGAAGSATGIRLPVIESDPDETDTPILRRLRAESLLRSDRLAFIPHRPNYLLPFAHGGNLTGSGALSNESLRQAEFRFQLSLKLPLTEPGEFDAPTLFFAYTGQSWWQAYQSKRSSPFREYNHDPELFIQMRSETPILGWTHRVSSFGFEHTSNGREELQSRSWNRIFAHLEFDRGSQWWLSLRGWARIPESAKDDPTDTSGDDNPGITRYLGHGELRFGYLGETWNWNAMLRRSLRSGGKGAAEFNLSYPSGLNRRARWYLQVFDGYGESLIDYDRRIKRFGLGIMINDWY